MFWLRERKEVSRTHIKKKNWTKEEIEYWQNLSDEEFEEHLRKMQEKREERNFKRVIALNVVALLLNMISLGIRLAIVLAKL